MTFNLNSFDALKNLAKSGQGTTKTKSEKTDAPNAFVGLKFEKEIQATCDIYYVMKKAYIQKFDPPVRMAFDKDKKNANGKPKAFMVKGAKTGFDFVGAIADTKQAIFIECKSTEKGDLPLWQENTGLKRHQIEKMLWLSELGFLTYVLWEIRKNNVVYKFTIQQLLDGVGGSKKLTMFDAEEMRFSKVLRVKKGVVEYYDFLNYLE